MTEKDYRQLYRIQLLKNENTEIHLIFRFFFLDMKYYAMYCNTVWRLSNECGDAQLRHHRENLTLALRV